ncbi:MAG TPA: acyl-ACP--UDP-N-acetylglucosamine O-acyltransferase [Myxococcota bacterium]|nr:acyl-ACP--UDP-N-acetylglucosamine O-acyltransferase [Myxococcota bacterium]
MASIHPTAVVDPGAKLADDVVVGPLSVVDGEVELGPGVELASHVLVTGRTRVGARTRIFPFSAVGVTPQTLGFDGNAGELVIGSDNVIREHASLHVGLPEWGALTKIGDHNLIMNGVHVAHDCRIGSHCVLSAQAVLGGHVHIEDHAVLGGMTAVHQFVRIGQSGFTAGGAMVAQDVPPFSRVAGDRARFVGVNTINLERRGFAAARIATIKHAFHLLLHSKLRFEEACRRIEAESAGSEDVTHLLAFLRSAERGFIR